MATENVILHRTEKAAADLSGAQFTLVKYDVNGNLVQAGEGDRAWVLEDNPKLGAHGTIALVGIVKVLLGGQVSAGQNLGSDGSGHAIVADSGDAVCGIALHPGVSGDVCEMQTSTGNQP